MIALLAAAAAMAVVGALLLAFFGIPLLALLCQATWPLLRLAHLVRARVAMRREFPRALAQWTHPAAR